MKKTELNLQITSILERNKIELSSELAKELLSLVAVKTKSSSPKVDNPPLVGDRYYSELEHSISDITDLYCNWFKEYRPVSEFNKSTKSKTGYHYECKEAEKHWKQYAKDIAQCKEDITLEKNAVLDGVKTIEEAKAEISQLEAQLSQLESDRLNKINHPLLAESLGVQEEQEVQETKKKSKKSNKEA